MSLELNKIAAAGLTAGIVAMAAGFVADLIVHRESLQEHAYPIAVAEPEAPAGAAEESAPESILPLLASADPAAGESLTRACTACHTFEQGGANRVGPNLYGVVGGPVAHLDGFSYSDALASMHDEGETWTYENLSDFLASPRGWAPGTKMTYAGMRKIEDRANMIAYLREQSDNPPPLPTEEEVQAVAPAGEEASPEAAASDEEVAMPAATTESADQGAADQETADQETADQETADQETGAAGEEQAAAAGEGGGSGIGPLIAAADPAEGERAARKCAACHTFDEGGANRVGPNLYGVPGAVYGHRDDYTYSSAFQERREAGDTWTYDDLWAYLQNPRGHVPGTKMTFAGLKNEEELAAVIAYLRQQSSDAPPVE